MAEKFYWKIVFGAVAAVGFGTLIFAAFVLERKPHDHFAWQAESFLNGRLDIPIERVLAEGNTTMDMVRWGGKLYWPLNPLPSLLMAPIVAIAGTRGTQGVLHAAAVAAVFLLAYQIARRRGLPAATSRWLALALVFGSVFIGVIVMNGPWYVAHTVCVAFALAGLLEFSGRDRPAAIGFLTALVWSTRSTAGLAVFLFFFLETVLRRSPWPDKIRRITLFGLPVAAAVAALGMFNWARFGNPLETGYLYTLAPAWPEAHFRDDFGLFNTAVIGRNIYYYFLRLPDLFSGSRLVDGRGLSFFLLSPVFFWIAGLRRLNGPRLAAASAAAGVTALLLCYYTSGFRQLGPRYMCDVLPLLFLLLVEAFRDRSFGAAARAVIAGSAAVDLALALVILVIQPY